MRFDPADGGTLVEQRLWWTGPEADPGGCRNRPRRHTSRSRRVIGSLTSPLLVGRSLPPIFSHSPFGTYFHSSAALSVLAWPAQECLRGAAIVLAGFRRRRDTSPWRRVLGRSGDAAEGQQAADRRGDGDGLEIHDSSGKVCLWNRSVGQQTRPEPVYFAQPMGAANITCPEYGDVARGAADGKHSLLSDIPCGANRGRREYPRLNGATDGPLAN